MKASRRGDEPDSGEEQAEETPAVVLVVRFAGGEKLPYRTGKELDQALEELLGEKLTAFRKAYPGAVFGPRYTSVSPERLVQLSKWARERTPGSEDPGFRQTFELRVPNVKNVRKLTKHVAQWEDHVLHTSRPTLGALRPFDASGAGAEPAQRLHYQEPAQRTVPAGGAGAMLTYDWGVDAEYAWSLPNGKGDDMAVVDVEAGWHFDHDDLKNVAIDICLPPEGTTFVNGDETADAAGLASSQTHGTAVLGILVGDPAIADVGITGIAHKVAHVAVAGEFYKKSNGVLIEFAEPHNAIIAAMSKLEDYLPGGGGVMLIETSEDWSWYDKTLGKTGVPIELRAEVHKELLEAANCLYTVIEAAGNGGEDLDKLDYAMNGIESGSACNPPGLPVDISNPLVNDSKAILVGSADPPISFNGGAWEFELGVDEQLRRLDSSCFGARIDCYGWGDYVMSCHKPEAQYIRFNGTSSAAAVVAGVVLVMQGLWKEHGTSDFLTPTEVRDILRDPSLGTPVYARKAAVDNPETAEDETQYLQVGHIPDLLKILTLSAKFKPLGLGPDVFLRDNKDDVGIPHGGAISQSPDVIVKQASEADPNDKWGHDSGTETSVTLSDDVEENKDHFVYVRAKNRGKAVSRNTWARVSWCKPSTLITPGMWTEIGQGGARFDPIPNDEKLVVSEELLWPAAEVPVTGHYCFVATIYADGDSPDDPPVFADFAAYKQFIRDKNNVTWRNFNVVELDPFELVPPDPDELPFWVPGAFDGEEDFEMQIEIKNPDELIVMIEVPVTIFDTLVPTIDHVAAVGGAATKLVEVTSLPAGHNDAFVLGTVTLPKYDAEAGGDPEPEEWKLHFKLNDPKTRRTFDVSVVQRHEGQEVGRITWRIKGPHAVDDDDTDDVDDADDDVT